MPDADLAGDPAGIDIHLSCRGVRPYVQGQGRISPQVVEAGDPDADKGVGLVNLRPAEIIHAEADGIGSVAEDAQADGVGARTTAGLEVAVVECIERECAAGEKTVYRVEAAAGKGKAGCDDQQHFVGIRDVFGAYMETGDLLGVQPRLWQQAGQDQDQDCLIKLFHFHLVGFGNAYERHFNIPAFRVDAQPVVVFAEPAVQCPDADDIIPLQRSCGHRQHHPAGL